MKIEFICKLCIVTKIYKSMNPFSRGLLLFGSPNRTQCYIYKYIFIHQVVKLLSQTKITCIHKFKRKLFSKPGVHLPSPRPQQLNLEFQQWGRELT